MAKAATREGAIARARTGFDDGSFIERLRALVAVPTESHPPLRKPELERYCRFFSIGDGIIIPWSVVQISPPLPFSSV